MCQNITHLQKGEQNCWEIGNKFKYFITFNISILILHFHLFSWYLMYIYVRILCDENRSNKVKI